MLDRAKIPVCAIENTLRYLETCRSSPGNKARMQGKVQWAKHLKLVMKKEIVETD